MTPQQEQAVISLLDNTALVLEGYAVRENDLGTQRRLFAHVKRLRDLSREISPIVINEVGDL